MSGLTAERRFGVYEKALPPGSWEEMLDSAQEAGYDFVEMSVDESSDRLARLSWGPAERKAVLDAIRRVGPPIYSLCLSAHRRFGLGSRDVDVRLRAAQILDQALALASDVGARVVQVAGYHAYYEPTDPAARARYVDGLRHGAALAAQRGVMLGIENIDTTDMASGSDCLRLCTDVDSPWFRVYPDVGNFAVHGLDVTAELRRVASCAVGLHLKDARLGEPRRVPFGAGTVPFDSVFRELSRLPYAGPLTVEMWNDDPATAGPAAAAALTWLKDTMRRNSGAVAGKECA